MDEQRFRAFHAATAGPLWGYLCRSCGNHAAADDLTQESYLRFLRSSFEPESELHARRYLFRIASNLVRDRLRRPCREVQEELVETKVIPNSGTIGLRQDLESAIGQLKPRDRQVLWLCHIEGASHQEVATALDLELASVRVIAFRARKKLARLLRQGDFPQESSHGR